MDGERTTMHPGDFILTPNWTFHDHGNPGSKPTVWLDDGLDLHIVNLLGASFASHHQQDIQPLTRPDGDAAVRYGANLLPVEYKSSSQAAPLFCYPYDRSREALEMLHRNGPLDPLHGAKLQYINPVTGGFIPHAHHRSVPAASPQEFPGPRLPGHRCHGVLLQVSAAAKWVGRRSIGTCTTCLWLLRLSSVSHQADTDVSCSASPTVRRRRRLVFGARKRFLMLLPTSLVGSMPQPDWLIDRKRLAGRFPPRTRAKELWRIAPEWLEAAQDDATLVAIREQERAGLDIITDGEIRRESYSNRFATALEGVDLDNPGTALDRSGHPNPVPRVSGKIRRKHAVWKSATLCFFAPIRRRKSRSLCPALSP